MGFLNPSPGLEHLVQKHVITTQVTTDLVVDNDSTTSDPPEHENTCNETLLAEKTASIPSDRRGNAIVR